MRRDFETITSVIDRPPIVNESFRANSSKPIRAIVAPRAGDAIASGRPATPSRQNHE
jgi:hypothetical protein